MPPTSFLRRRAPQTATALTPDARPLLAAGVAFEKGIDEAAWIVMLHGVPSSRVSGAVVDMLTALDGETPLHVLHMRFAAAESWENFLGLVLRFRASGL